MLRVADLELDPVTRRVRRGSKDIELTPDEYRLLEFLVRHAGMAVPKAAVLIEMWGADCEISERILENVISRLRNRIDRGVRQTLVHTHRGLGYSVRKRSSR